MPGITQINRHIVSLLTTLCTSACQHNTDKQAHSEFANNAVHICMPGINTNKQAHSEKIYLRSNSKVKKNLSQVKQQSEKNLCQVKQQSEPKYGNPENSCAQK